MVHVPSRPFFVLGLCLGLSCLLLFVTPASASFDHVKSTENAHLWDVRSLWEVKKAVLKVPEHGEKGSVQVLSHKNEVMSRYSLKLGLWTVLRNLWASNQEGAGEGEVYVPVFGLTETRWAPLHTSWTHPSPHPTFTRLQVQPAYLEKYLHIETSTEWELHVLFLVIGIVLHYAAAPLSSSKVFYTLLLFLMGMVFGAFILLFLIFKNIDVKSIIFASIGIVFFSFAYETFQQYQELTYVVCSVALSLFLLFIYPDELSPSKKRFLFWVTHLVSLVCLFLATELVEFSFFVLFVLHFVPQIITSRPIQTLLFPLWFILQLPLVLFSSVAPVPKKKMLTMAEYHRQTVVETDSNILKLVHQIRKDPLVLSSISNPITRQALRSWSHLPSDDLIIKNYHEYITKTLTDSSSSSSSSSPSSPSLINE